MMTKVIGIKQQRTRVRHLDNNTFSEYYLQFIQLVVSKFKQKGLTWQVAEELAQEVFKQAYEKRSQFRGNNSKAFMGWLNTIILNHWKNHLRTKSTLKRNVETVPFLETDREEHHDHATPEWHFLQNKSQDEIGTAIGELPRHLTEVLILKVFHDYSYTQIATLTKSSESQVRNRLFQARSQLKDLLGR